MQVIISNNLAITLSGTYCCTVKISEVWNQKQLMYFCGQMLYNTVCLCVQGFSNTVKKFLSELPASYRKQFSSYCLNVISIEIWHLTWQVFQEQAK